MTWLAVLDFALWATGVLVWGGAITMLAGLIGAFITVGIQAAMFSYRIHQVIAPRTGLSQFFLRWKYLVTTMPDAMRVRTAVNPDLWVTLMWDGTEPVDY